MPAERASSAAAGALPDMSLRRCRDLPARAGDDAAARARAAAGATGCARASASSATRLAEQPFTTKSQLRDAYPFGMLKVPLDRVHPRSTRRRARAGRRRSSRTRATTSRSGPTAVRAALAAAGGAPGTRRARRVRLRACSPAGSASTTAPSGSGARSSPRRAATRRGRRSCSRTCDAADPLLHAELRARVGHGNTYPPMRGRQRHRYA